MFADETVLDDVFFDYATPGSPLVQPYSGQPPLLVPLGTQSQDSPQVLEGDALTGSDRALPTLWESNQQRVQGASDDEDHRGENGKSEETQPLQR